MVVRKLVAALLVVASSSFGGPPHVPPRKYPQRVTVVLGDEALVLFKATDAALTHLRKSMPNASLGSYFARIEHRAPSAWVVTWIINDIDARGGAIEVTLDATGTKVVSVVDIE